MGSDLLKLVRFFFETALFIGFFHGVKPQCKIANTKKVIALSTFSLLFLLYFFDNLFPSIILRFVLRFIIFILYLKLIKCISWQKAAYISGISCSAYYALQNIFITPLLYPFFIESFLIVYILFVLLFVFLYYNISFDKINHIDPDRVILVVSVIICILYVKYSLSVMIDTVFLTNIEMTIFPIFLQLFLIASIVLFEKFHYASMQEEEARIQEVITDYKLQNIKHRLSAEDDLRILNHDMKNHFIAIKKLAKNNNLPQLKEYINSLLLTFETNDKYVEAGNELLNAFLSEKIGEAENNNIEVSVILDFRPASFISDIDICTIFGNALDNAIEANKKVENPSDRFISIYSTFTAGQIVISFANSYIGIINEKNGLPITTKTISKGHGFGLSSIKKALTKYDGVISINTDSKNKFILNIMVPIPE